MVIPTNISRLIYLLFGQKRGKAIRLRSGYELGAEESRGGLVGILPFAFVCLEGGPDFFVRQCGIIRSRLETTFAGFTNRSHRMEKALSGMTRKLIESH